LEDEVKRLSKQRHALIVEFRLEGMRMDWAVYWALSLGRLSRVRDYLEWGKENPSAWDYFSTYPCNLMDADMERALEIVSK
jgi:hypothetical protein